MPLPRKFLYSSVYKWLVLVHSRRITTLDGVLLNARSSNAKVNKAVEINSNSASVHNFSLISKSYIRITRAVSHIRSIWEYPIRSRIRVR